jgi:hypothetical protein
MHESAHKVYLPFTIYDLLSTIQWIPLRQPDISFNIQPEGENKINDQWRSHGEKRNINKPGADSGCCNAETFADRSTNAEGLPFYEFLKPVH